MYPKQKCLPGYFSCVFFFFFGEVNTSAKLLSSSFVTHSYWPFAKGLEQNYSQNEEFTDKTVQLWEVMDKQKTHVHTYKQDTWCQNMSLRVSSCCWILCVQFGENRQVLQALRTLLDDFREELQEEETRRCQLQQSYANDKAAWEMKWAEMKCQVAQVQMVSQCRPP